MGKIELLNKIHALSGRFTPEEPFVTNTLKRISLELLDSKVITPKEHREIYKTLEELDL